MTIERPRSLDAQDDVAPYQPETLDLRSRDLTADRIAQLKALFPEVFREDEIDFDALRRSLGDWTVEPGRERFGLSWPGKADCMRIIQQPSLGTLIPDREQSVDFDSTRNVVIEGDNLEVLKLLQNSYYGKVKMIYIDPPYNTGNDFIYPDRYAEGLTDYLRYSGQVNENGHRQTTNTDTSGRFHSKWLNMMYPRLFLARNLLRDNGVIFVSIDDGEVAYLRDLLDQIFGAENYLTTFVWQARTSISNDQLVSSNHHYQVVYGRSISNSYFVGEKLDSDEYSNPDGDLRGAWKPVPLDANKPGGNTLYPIVNPLTGASFLPPSGRSWAINPTEYLRLEQDKRIWFGKKGTSSPKRKLFLSDRLERGDTKTPSSLLLDAGTTQSGTREIIELFEGKAFAYPKPTTLIQRLLEFTTIEDDIVLDFFAGSGTTGHAVMKLNAEDGGNRRYILVQLPEPVDNGGPYRTISEITRERLRRAGAQVREQATKAGKDVAGLDTGFQAYSLAESNFRQWDGRASDGQSVEQQLHLLKDNVRPDSTPRAILSELILAAGFELTTTVERIAVADQHAWSIADGALLICLERRIAAATITAMAERDPAQIICLDASFANDDQLRVNAAQTIRARARQHDRTIAFKVV